MGNVKSIDVRIDSPGGSVTDASTMYALLMDHSATINMRIDGLAASAASYLAMAGDNISINEAGFMMIHAARAYGSGTATDFRKIADTLDMVTDTISNVYVARTSQNKKTIDDWMRAETWFTGREAKENGFADTLIENKTAGQKNRATARAKLYVEAFGALPEALRPKAENGGGRRDRTALLNDARALMAR